MNLPADIRQAVEPVLGVVGDAVAVTGGCVSESVRVTTGAGTVFLKYDRQAPAGLFEVEAEGLRELRAAATSLRVPEVIGWGDHWLALEWLDASAPGVAADERLGSGLAELHRTRSGHWGWHRQGFIGPLPQDNTPCPRWSEFWVARRLEPQLRRSRDAGAAAGADKDWSRLFDAIPAALRAAEAEGASLLHGDLWSGNMIVTAAGEVTLVDPAVYHGHREVDLAMADLFGGFGASFLAAYHAAWPLSPGYGEVRRGIYQLYYLLVHVNLFGGGYAERTRRVLQDVLREV